MKKGWPLLVVLYISFYAFPADAFIGLCCGKCGGNMPMNILGAGVPETNEFRFKISPMIMRMGGLRDGTSSVNSDSLLGSSGTSMETNSSNGGMDMPMNMATGMNMNTSSDAKFMAVPESMDMRMLNFATGYSFTDDFFAGLMFMWKENMMNMKFNSMMKSMTGKDGFTMESSGMADTMLMSKYRLYTDDPLIPTKQVSLFMGLNLPTGSINEKNRNHPVDARKSELLPYSMQLGSGTFDPMLGVVYQASASPWWWGANLIYTGRWYKNAHDYSLGDEFKLDFYAMYQLRYDLVAQIQLNGRSWGKIKGEMDEAVSGESGRATKDAPGSAYMTPIWNPDNYGGQSVFATAGLQWQPIPLHILDMTVGKPVYQDLNGPQMEEDYRVMVTWYIEAPTSSSVRYTGEKKHGKSRLGF